MAGKLLVEEFHQGQVVRLVLNAPKANVVDSEMMAEMQVTLDRLATQPQVKMIQLTGAGKHFSFGAAVEEHVGDKAKAMLEQFHRLFYTLGDLGIPTMALVSGQCLGGGLELALMCNLLFVDESSRMGQPEIMLGVFAPPASLILPMKIGQSRADDLLISGRSITGMEAVEFGLATECFADREAMLTGADSWIEQHILPRSASSLKFAVKASRMQFNRILRKKLPKLEKLYLDDLMETSDANEGIDAFMNKRKPDWQDK